MRQFTKLDTSLKEKIVRLETDCERLCENARKIYSLKFKSLGQEPVIEMARTIKGRTAPAHQVFTAGYESYIDIGIEDCEEYYPHAYIPIWKCKEELFQKTGYLTMDSVDVICAKIANMADEMYKEIEKKQ
ncbi:hypothetical protein [Bacillus sp. T33-2]|uniref:hypothetical protein n=1 Tax=Bacillus sp. T33-2 TaxID=2054168 RepID=UPI000C76347A|nr:hypothetical protein [Bacillus sp. T33-2]PLR98862.1 hypothetical protein CVD19_04305 [Bacillus sp. T33-2]